MEPVTLISECERYTIVIHINAGACRATIGELKSIKYSADVYPHRTTFRPKKRTACGAARGVAAVTPATVIGQRAQDVSDTD